MTRQHVKKGSRRETFKRKSPGRLHVAEIHWVEPSVKTIYYTPACDCLSLARQGLGSPGRFLLLGCAVLEACIYYSQPLCQSNEPKWYTWTFIYKPINPRARLMDRAWWRGELQNILVSGTLIKKLLRSSYNNWGKSPWPCLCPSKSSPEGTDKAWFIF